MAISLVGSRLPNIALVCTDESQATLTGIYRWLVLSLIAYLLAHWAYLSIASPNLPDWGEAAKLALEVFLSHLVVLVLLLEVQRLQPLAKLQGFEIQVIRCKM